MENVKTIIVHCSQCGKEIEVPEWLVKKTDVKRLCKSCWCADVDAI